MNFLFILLALTQTSIAAECVQGIKSLKTLMKNENFALNWTETTADDGKPLMVSISEKDNTLHLEFIKNKEGLWAKGTARICKDKEITASITKKDISLGKAAPWVMRMSMKDGAKFTLKMIKSDVLKISTFGWSGEFIPTPVERLVVP